MATTNMQKHQAGRHLVVGQALLRGLRAELDGPRGFVVINGRRTRVHVAVRGDWQIGDIDANAREAVDNAVLVDARSGTPAYFVVSGDEMRAFISAQNERFLKSHGGRRPRTPDSRHAAIRVADVGHWKDRWSLFE